MPCTITFSFFEKQKLIYATVMFISIFKTWASNCDEIKEFITVETQ